VRVGIPSLRQSGGSTLRGKLIDSIYSSVCMAPLRLVGLRGKKSTPSIGWEVPVKSQRLASGRSKEHQLPKIISRPSSLSVTVFYGFCNCIDFYC
jgi:hypothetical protein